MSVSFINASRVSVYFSGKAFIKDKTKWELIKRQMSTDVVSTTGLFIPLNTLGCPTKLLNGFHSQLMQFHTNNLNIISPLLLELFCDLSRIIC